MNAWLAQHFFNPSFVLPWGAALVAAPIIIHLINRMRYKRVQFAAMEFLLQSEERNRRRLLFEQLLLLLLRVLIVVGLLALIARLILDPAELSVFRGAKLHHVVLLDDSGSMRERWGQTTAFEDGISVVKKLVAEGARRPNTQRFSLLLLSEPDQPFFSQRDVNDTFLSELETKLENLRCSHRSLDMVRGLEAARMLLAEDKAATKHLHLVSDFRLSNWRNQQALGSSVRELDELGVTVNLVKTVPDAHQNLAVTRLSGEPQAAVGVPMRLQVGVKNFGTQVAENVRLAIVQDGQRLPLSVKFDKIEAAIEVVREFDVKFDVPGKHRLQVGLENDALAADNTRFMAVDIVTANPVLIIDGDPNGHEASYVADALAADPGLTGLAPLIETPDYLRKHPLDRFRSICLVNVPELLPDAVAPLEEYVKNGGGLVWFLGDLVKPAHYNDKLYRQGNGLFPVQLASARQDLQRRDETAPGPDLNFLGHPIFRIFEGQDNPFVESVKIDSYLPVADSWITDDNDRRDGVSTIAVLRTKQPLVFEHRLGEGRVVTSLTSAGPSWNTWARNPSYVIYQLELAKFVSRSESTHQGRVVGEPIAVSLDPAVYTETIEISAPETAGQRVTRLQAAPERLAGKPDPNDKTRARGANSSANNQQGAVHLAAAFRETDLPGVYELKLLDHDQIPSERWIAYNAPIAESDLELASNRQIRERIGTEVRVQIQEPGDFQWVQGRNAGQEVRIMLLSLLLVVLLAEQWLAYRASYHPTTSSAA
jgi:hypothetical protein